MPGVYIRIWKLEPVAVEATSRLTVVSCLPITYKPMAVQYGRSIPGVAVNGRNDSMAVQISRIQ